MNNLQVVLVCILAVLGVAFFIVLYMRFHENTKTIVAPSKKTLTFVVSSLEQNALPVEQWDRIWPCFYKNGEINYSKIDSILTYIINHEKYAHIRSKAVALLKDRVAVTVFGDNEITEAIDVFMKDINQCGNQDVKDSGYELIKRVQRFCRTNVNNKKYDFIIQWIFNAIELVGFILAIVTL